MFNRVKLFFYRTLSIKPSDNVPEGVARYFKHNVIVNTLDLMFFFFADSLWSINTIMPVFAATLTDSPFIIGLMPAIVNAGWFIPQMFISGVVSRSPKKLPLSRKFAIAERLPYLFFPALALAIPHISKATALTFLLILMSLRGIFGGLSALPWQEVMATVFPISHRARVFGISRVFGQSMGVVGSAIAAVVLSRLQYPYNYATGFFIAVIAQWLSFASYSQNREPERAPVNTPTSEAKPSPKAVDFHLFGDILRRDGNLRMYLIARSATFLGSMGSAFLAVYGIHKLALSDEQAAIFTGVLFASGILGYAVWAALGDKIGPKRIVMISLFLWVISLVVVLTAKVIWVYYLVFVFYGIHSSGMGLGDLALVMELGEEDLRPTYLGMARTLTGSVLLLAPVLAGWLVESRGYPLMFAASIAFTLLGTLLMNRVRDVPRGLALPVLTPAPAMPKEE